MPVISPAPGRSSPYTPMRGQRRQFHERRSGIEQHLDALACQQLARLQVLVAGLRAAAERRCAPASSAGRRPAAAWPPGCPRSRRSAGRSWNGFWPLALCPGAWQNCPTVGLSNDPVALTTGILQCPMLPIANSTSASAKSSIPCASRCAVSPRNASRRARPTSTAATSFRAICGRRWASWACSASPCPRTAAPASAISRTPWPWRRSRAPRPPWA